MSYFGKKKISYDDKSVRERNSYRHLQNLPSEEDDDYDREDAWIGAVGDSDHHQPGPPAISPVPHEDDNEGYQPVIHRFTKKRKDTAEAQKAKSELTAKVKAPVPTMNDNAPATIRDKAPVANLNERASTEPSSRSSTEFDDRATTSRTSFASKLPPPMKTPDAPQRRFQPIFQFSRDNPARAAFRQRQAHTGSFPLHKAIVEIEPDTMHLHNWLVEIGVRFGSFVRPPQTAYDKELLIWGNPRQLASTIGELRDWTRQREGLSSSRPLAKHNFAKELSVMSLKYKDVQKDMQRKAEIDRFQQVPDPSQHFAYKGAYLWPIEDVKPQEIFGPNLEAFDQIRFALKCHITFDIRLKVFRIYTSRESVVAKALKRIEGTLREYHARNALYDQPFVLNLAEPPDRDPNRQDVRLQVHAAAEVNGIEQHIPVLTGGILDVKASLQWKAQRQEMATSNAVHIQQALGQTLQKLRYYRGQVRMRIFFGTFALSRFKWPKGEASISLEKFLANLTQSGTKGKLIRDLQFKDKASEILSKIYSLNAVFEPFDSMTESLSEVARTYGARFEIHRYEMPTVQLEVEMKSSPFDGELYETTNSLWTRRDRRDNSAPLEIFMIRLGGGASWKLQISTENQLDPSRIDPKMVDFAKSVKLKRTSKTGAELDGRRLFDWETALPGCLKPSIFEQKTGLRFRVKHMPEFIFELARYDSYDLSTNSQTPCTAHWGASMWNNDWDLKLSRNAGLALGECANWDARLEAFFPNTDKSQCQSQRQEEIDAGLRWFLQHLQMIIKSLDRIKEVRPYSDE